MKQLLSILFTLYLCVNYHGFAQIETFVSKGEYGMSVGISNYMGDLNPYATGKKSLPSLHLFYQKYYNNYVSVKMNLGYVKLDFSDAQHQNPTYKNRNLHFSNDILEFSINSSLHFFKFVPGYQGNKFTPYISIGAGIILHSPYTFLSNGDKVYLRPLGTEGQYSQTAHEGKKYSPVAGVFPISMGVKQAISNKITIMAEASYRFTTTDYIDDVSTTYAGSQAFLPHNYKGKNPLQAHQMQDRSLQQKYTQGMQRGNSLNKDGYFNFQIGISYNLNTCNCPKVY